MKTHAAVIGFGIAGLAAARTLAHAGCRVTVLEKESRMGGRLAPLRLGGVDLDPCCPCILSSDRGLAELARQAGVAADMVMAPGTIRNLRQTGEAASSEGGLRAKPCALRHGMESLWRRLPVECRVLLGTAVSAIRWDERTRSFVLRDRSDGASVRDPDTGAALRTDAVVIATTGTEAALIAAASRPLQPVAASLAPVRYAPAWAGAFTISHLETDWYALHGQPGDPLEWLSREEVKVPGRVPRDLSVLLARPGAGLAASFPSLSEAEWLERLYGAVRGAVPAVPVAPALSAGSFWQDGTPVPGTDVRIGPNGIPTDPPGLAIALAGDYAAGPRVEDAAASGFRAAQQALARLGERVR